MRAIYIAAIAVCILVRIDTRMPQPTPKPYAPVRVDPLSLLAQDSENRPVSDTFEHYTHVLSDLDRSHIDITAPLPDRRP